MQAAISDWLNLEKIVFKPENENIYSTNDHLWHSKFGKYCVQDMKKCCCSGEWQEAQVTVNREGKRDN